MPNFDLFLSHNSVDKPWVARLKEDLQRYGLTVWLDRDEIRPGDLFAQALEEAMDDCRAVALVISPEEMASGWVREEYYRALSLTKDRTRPAQLIPLLLRQAEVPPFVQSRDWVDFREEAEYARSVWELVWGITGQKPPEVLDLNAPPPPPVTGGTPHPQEKAPAQAEPASAAGPGMRTGGIKAGGKIEAENVVDGVQLRGGDAELARAALELARNLQTGGIEAGGDIIARNVVSGFQFIEAGQTPNPEQFRRELEALRDQLETAIAAGEFADEYEAEDARTALKRATEQAAADRPAVDKITGQLAKAGRILIRAGETALKAGQTGAAIIKLAPLVTALKELAERTFS